MNTSSAGPVGARSNERGGRARRSTGPDRIAAHQEPVQRMAVSNQRRVVNAILSEHRGDRVRVPGDRTGIHVTFEYFFMCDSHSPV